MRSMVVQRRAALTIAAALIIVFAIALSRLNGTAPKPANARIVRRERSRNPIEFLIDDGEEQGLLGAEAFAGERNATDAASAVVNLEARGTGGASFLFETSPNNRWFLPIVARALPRPIT